MSAWGSRGQTSDARDMSVANLLKQIFDRSKEQKTDMTKVSNMLNKIRRRFIFANERAEIIKLIAKVIDERMIQTAILVTAGDRMAMMYLIKKSNQLTNQLLRPSPRVLRTKQLFNAFQHAWRYSIGLHQSRWEEILQNNSVAILKDIPIIKGAPNTKKSLGSRIRNAMTSGNDVQDEE